MKKVLLTLATVLVTLCSNAQEVGEYFFTSTGRYKVTDVLDVVQPGEDWNNYSAEIFSPYKAETEDDVDGIESLKSDEGDFISYAFPIEHGAQYVITFSFMGTADKSSSNADGALNQIDAWASPQDDQGTRAGTTNIDYMQVASTFTIKANEWVDVSWTFIDTLAANAEGGYLNILFSRINTEYIIATNLKIIKVEQVYDTRIAQRKIDFVKKLMEDPNFDTEEAAELKEELAATIEGVQEMIDGNDESFDSEDQAVDLIANLDEYIDNFLNVTSQSMNGQLANIDITSLGGYGRSRIETMLGCLDIIKENWGHISGSDALRSAIQKGNWTHTATLKIKNSNFPAGKYFFSAEMRNADTDNTSWPCNLIFTLTTEGTTMWVGGNTITLEQPLAGEAYQQFYVIGDVAEDGTFEAGVYWPGPTGSGKIGGAFEIRNLQVRGFGNPLDKVARVQAWSSFITQWNAAVSARTALIAKADDANYPWANDTIQKTLDQWDPYYNQMLELGWIDADGNDTGVATNEELEEWTTYHGIELYNEEGERLKYQLVRNYQSANNYIVAQNQPIADLNEKIASAITIRDDAMNSACDKDIINEWIDAAQTLYDDIIANTNDERQEADTENINTQLNSYQDVIDAFIASGELLPIIDIDFSNGFTAIPDPEDPETALYYTIEGNAGTMVFQSGKFTTDNTMGGEQKNVMYSLGYNGENEDVLRIGNSEATVTLSEDQIPTENDVLKVSFDIYYLKLSGKHIWIDMRDEEGNRNGGIKRCIYSNGSDYNDFGNMAISPTDAGTGGINTAWKCHYEFTYDFKARTLQGKSEGKSTSNGDPVAMLNYNPSTTFVLGSDVANYTDRRCWFDNLLIYKYPSNAEGISDIYTIAIKKAELKTLIDETKAIEDLDDESKNTVVAEAQTVYDNAAATLAEVEAAIAMLQDVPTGIITIATSAKVNTPAAIYTLSGSKVNALQKGINIVKYADGQVKKVLVK